MRRVRNGRYVKTSNGTGIIFDIKDMPMIDIHLIDKKGETIGQEKLHIDKFTVLDAPLPMRIALKPRPAKLKGK